MYTAKILKAIEVARENGHNFHPEYTIYDSPINGWFNIDTNVYDPKSGWIEEQRLIRIIGENKRSFIEQVTSGYTGYWVGPEVIRFYYKCPHGVHKSRFIKWETTQLELFIQ